VLQCLQKVFVRGFLLQSDRLWTFRRYQHLQESRRITNAAGDCYEWFGEWRMFLRQCFEARTDFVEVIDFAQDRLKRHWAHRSLAQTPKVGELQMDWLRSEDLKEEKVITTPRSL
jgi:hypothetical protein